MLKRYMQDVDHDPVYHKRAAASTPFETVPIVFLAASRDHERAAPRPMSSGWRSSVASTSTPGHHAEDIDHPDELRFDFDPTPRIRLRAREKGRGQDQGTARRDRAGGMAQDVRKPGIHVYIRIEPLWDFIQTRRAVLAFA